MITRPSTPLLRVLAHVAAGGWVPISRHNAGRLLAAHQGVRVQARDFMAREWRDITNMDEALKPRTVYRACKKE